MYISVHFLLHKEGGCESYSKNIEENCFLCIQLTTRYRHYRRPMTLSLGQTVNTW